MRKEKSTFATDELSVFEAEGTATDELMQTADRQLAGERGDSEFMRKTEEKRWLLEKGRRYEKDVREIR